MGRARGKEYAIANDRFASVFGTRRGSAGGQARHAAVEAAEEALLADAERARLRRQRFGALEPDVERFAQQLYELYDKSTDAQTPGTEAYAETTASLQTIMQNRGAWPAVILLGVEADNVSRDKEAAQMEANLLLPVTDALAAHLRGDGFTVDRSLTTDAERTVRHLFFWRRSEEEIQPWERLIAAINCRAGTGRGSEPLSQMMAESLRNADSEIVVKYFSSWLALATDRVEKDIASTHERTTLSSLATDSKSDRLLTQICAPLRAALAQREELYRDGF